MSIYKMKICGYVLKNEKDEFLAPLGTTTQEIDNAYKFYHMQELKARVSPVALKELTIVPLYNFEHYKEDKNDHISGIQEETRCADKSAEIGKEEK